MMTSYVVSVVESILHNNQFLSEALVWMTSQINKVILIFFILLNNILNNKKEKQK